MALSSGATNRFVKATVIDQSSNIVYGPLTLPHDFAGVYKEDTLTMPNQAQVDAIFEVFTDAGLTNRDPNYGSAIDVYEQDDFDPVNLIPKDKTIFAKFGPDLIRARVFQNPPVRGMIKTTGIKGQIKVSTMKARIVNAEIQGVLHD